MESSEATKSGSQKHAYNDPWAAPVMLSTVILFARVRSLFDILKYTLKRNERWDPAYKRAENHDNHSEHLPVATGAAYGDGVGMIVIFDCWTL